MQTFWIASLSTLMRIDLFRYERSEEIELCYQAAYMRDLEEVKK